uniref:Uncharacterized protein n=1 Tax=Oryza punctata TaxID=4537 RepID=A0A0E0MB26_ORYPU
MATLYGDRLQAKVAKKPPQEKGEMVKIEEIDAECDDDCCEIDPDEFARKVQLKVSDEVILVAAKGKIKVEANQPEGFGNLLDLSDSDNNLHPHHEYAAGDRMDNPYEIDEDKTTLEKLDDGEDKYIGDDLKVDEGDRCREKVIPVKISVKSEPEEHGAIGEEAAYDLLPEINGFSHKLFPAERRVFDEEDKDDVVVVALRDFPHPRHLCAKFPFDKTSHESRCRKCYCSVCEVPVSSCLNWKGTEGHCHATKLTKLSQNPSP